MEYATARFRRSTSSSGASFNAAIAAVYRFCSIRAFGQSIKRANGVRIVIEDGAKGIDRLVLPVQFAESDTQGKKNLL